HDHGPDARRTWRRGQRLLLARQAGSRDVDRLERLYPGAADLGSVAPAKRRVDQRRLVSAAQQGMRGRLHLHARADSQSGRLRIALVLHQAGRTLRHAPRYARPFSADALLGANGQHQINGLDWRLGDLRGEAVPTAILLYLSAAPRLRRPAHWAR